MYISYIKFNDIKVDIFLNMVNNCFEICYDLVEIKRNFN